MASIDDLTAISILARECSFRAASEVLGISTSALSRTVANIENEVGARLFNRTTRSVALTDAGKHFLLKISPALSEINTAISEVRDIRSQHLGTIRINADEAVARQILKPIIAAYMKKYPKVDIELICEGKLIDVVAEGYDAGIRSFGNVPKDMVAIPIKTDRRMVVVASPEYLKTRQAPQKPEDLRGHDCIVERYPSGRKFRWEFIKDNEPIT